MKLSKSIFWLLNFLKDKIFLVTFSLAKSNELESYRKAKEYSENFLNDFNHQEKVKGIWHTLLGEQLPIQESEICKIYRLSFTLLFDWSFEKVKYCIENHFWSSLDLYEIDTLNWEDKNVFENANLVTYAIIKTDNSCLIVLTSLHEQKYTLLKTYDVKELPLWKFKRRQLVYSAQKGYLSI